MSINLETIIASALAYFPVNGNFTFTCENEPFEISLHTVSRDELAKLDERLPEVATHLHNLYGTLGQKATRGLRLTLEHWRNPGDALLIKGTEFRSQPRTIKPAQHQDCAILTADYYNMQSLPSGATYAFARSYDYPTINHKNWLNENYPGTFDKMQYLLTIGEFSPSELASLVFPRGSSAVVDLTPITPY